MIARVVGAPSFLIPGAFDSCTLAVGVAAAGGGPIALISNTAAGSSDSGNSVTTGSIDTSGASLLVVVLADYSLETISVITDSKSNTWTPLTSSTSAFTRCTIFYVANPTVGTGHTFTATKAVNPTFPTICVASFSNVATTTPFDQQNGANSNAATSLSTGSITPTENDEVLIAGLCIEDPETLSINGGFTITNQVSHLVDQHFGGGMAYLIQTTAAAANPAWSWTDSVGCSARIASFKNA